MEMIIVKRMLKINTPSKISEIYSICEKSTNCGNKRLP
jgi:hypothetical protein